jgi:hypothetical protein
MTATTAASLASRSATPSFEVAGRSYRGCRVHLVSERAEDLKFDQVLGAAGGSLHRDEVVDGRDVDHHAVEVEAA